MKNQQAASQSALAGFISYMMSRRKHQIGPGVKRYGNPRSKYMPHQGKQEIALRLQRGW